MTFEGLLNSMFEKYVQKVSEWHLDIYAHIEIVVNCLVVNMFVFSS